MPQGPDNRQIFFDALTQKAGLTPQQALGVLWSMAGESGPGLNTQAYNPNDPGGALGAVQWVGNRRAGLEQVARQERTSVTDPYLQAGYLVGELTGNIPEAHLQTGVLAALKTAKTPEEAAHIWTAQMERPKVDNTDQRLLQRGQVGSLDAQGHFVPGTAKSAPVPIGSTPPAAATPTAGGQTPVASAYAPPSPEAMLSSSLGQELGGMSAPSTVRSGGGGEMDTPDQPAIRSMAAETDFMQPANPMPAQFAGGASGLGSQLGSLAAQPNTPMLEDPNASPSITAGAPSMTGMLGDLGTSMSPGAFDQRAGSQLSPNPGRRVMRLA